MTNSNLALRRVVADLATQEGLPGEFRELLRDLAAHWAQVRERIDAHARQDARLSKNAGIASSTLRVSSATP